MKKVLLSSVVLLSVVAASNVALAADGDHGGEYTSQGAITFTPNEGQTDPEDPNKPGEPVIPEIDPNFPGGPNPGTNGPLSIDFASSFYFGKQEITTTHKTYDTNIQEYVKKIWDKEKGEWVEDPAGTLTEGPNYVQVTDNRGTEAGWTLKVKQAKQFTSKENHVLKGATVAFKEGHVVTDSSSAAPTPVKEFTLNFDEGEASAESIVMEAKSGKGAGTYLNNFGTWNDTKETPGEFKGSAKKSVQLNVPGTTTKYAERYDTDFVWTLSDVVSTTPEV
ncbi:WxL domain-containing protein [Vagococcus fessus]|uniref:WxL domain-containing protein n=1 Tax=Vagococcus fessus TaxID=120370 RepID=UPI0039ED3C0E